MSILDTLHKLTAPVETSKPLIDLRHAIEDSGFFTSKRFLVTAGALVGLYFLHQVLTSDVLVIASWVIIAYILGESFTKGLTALANAWIRTTEIRMSYKNRKLEAKHPVLLSTKQP